MRTNLIYWMKRGKGRRCRTLLTGLGVVLALTGYGQGARVLDHNAIGWYVYNGDHTLSKKWGLHTEYQWRRVELIRSWQQSLARLGVSYKQSDRVKLSAGSTYLVTFPYGDYPQANQGKPYPEQRIYEDITLTDTYQRLRLEHRFRLEQRWLAGLAAAEPGATTSTGRVADWKFQNRIRYQISGKLSLTGARIGDRSFYLNFFDELFMGFGRNVDQNIFNQNRLSAGVGYQFHKGLQLELNALNQVVQHSKVAAVTGRPIFEINNGFRLNLNHTLDFAGKGTP